MSLFQVLISILLLDFDYCFLGDDPQTGKNERTYPQYFRIQTMVRPISTINIQAPTAMIEYRVDLDCFPVLDGLGISERKCQNIKQRKVTIIIIIIIIIQR